MDPRRWERIKELFGAVLALPAGERAAFLDATCAGDAELRREVESLVSADELAGDFLDAPAARMAPGAVASLSSGLEAGRRVGAYTVEGVLGEGGMGKVYLAEDARLGRKVALKLLPPSFTLDAERVRRFELEARAASALNHPGILTIYEIDADGPLRFIATEYVEGETLRARLGRGPLALADALDISIQLAAALSAAHAARVFHRDVKPENVMLRPDGYVKLLDFGLAKPAARTVAGGDSVSDPFMLDLINTSPGVVLGTVAYMSPEQARGVEVDARTDLWSLGVVLYECIAGRQPFTGPTPSDVFANVINREPPALSSVEPAAPTELERIVMKALAKERGERYQTAKDLLIDLRRLRQRLEFEAEMSRSVSHTRHATNAPAAPSTANEETHTAVQHSGEQLKQVTVLFADLRGLTSVADALDPEEAGQLMRELWALVNRVVTDHGGVVDRHMGEQAMALWGTQAAREDDPEQAIRAALRMQRETREHVAESLREHVTPRLGAHGGDDAPVGPVMRVGINTGTVLLSPSGGRGSFTATGGAVNVAQRLEQAAQVGEVFISHDTYRHVRGVFDVRELELEDARGREEPVRTYSVERAKPRAFHLRTRGVEGVETRMVGREAELARMRDALQTAIEDREAQWITVVGDAGLGKSRLLYEFSGEMELLRPARVSLFTGRASQWTRGLPYALVRDVFSYRFGIQESDPPAAAREKLERGLLEVFGGDMEPEEARMRAHFIGHLIGFDFSRSPHLTGILDDARQVRGRAFHYAAQFFERAALTAPTVLFLDDLHWADDGSLDFVDHLARACDYSPLLILCFARTNLLARRPAWGEGLANHARLALQPLTRRESRQLVEEILRNAQSIPHALRELVVSASEGNPFYVEELIKMLIDQRVILPAAERWEVDASRLVEVRVPPTLTGVLQARLDGLTPWERTVVQRASVIGREFWDGALDEFSRAARARGETAEGDTRAALESLRRKEIVYRREASGFAAASEYIFKHALLRSVAYENVLKRERRRLHGETAHWLISQGGERVEEYAAAIAEHLEMARDAGGAAEWYGRAGAHARTSYAPEAAIGFYRKALDFMREGAARDAAARDATDTIADARRAVRWYDGLGEVLTMQARYEEAAEAYTLMRGAAEEIGDAVAQARAWNGLTAVQEYRGDNRAALESARRAEALARASADSPAAKAELAVALNRQGLASHRLGDAAAVASLGRQVLELSGGMGEGSRHARANGLKLVGVAHEVSGRFTEADECFEQSLALLKELGDRRNIGFMLNNLGVIAHLRGDYEPAVRRYEGALAIFREIGERTWEPPTLGNLAGAQIGLDAWAEAESNLREAVRLIGPTGHFALSMVYCYLAEAFCGQGKLDEALAAAQMALALGQKTENQDYIASAWRALGLVAAARTPPVVMLEGREYEATECFAESLRVYTEMGAEAERARTLRDWGAYERARGQTETGDAMRREAREIFTRLNLEKELERMERDAAL